MFIVSPLRSILVLHGNIIFKKTQNASDLKPDSRSVTVARELAAAFLANCPLACAISFVQAAAVMFL